MDWTRGIYRFREMKQQHFHLAACWFSAKEAGWKDPGVVDHEQVTGPKQSGYLFKPAMVQCVAVAVECQEAGLAAPDNRLLGNQFFGQMVIVGCTPVLFFHAGRLMGSGQRGKRFRYP